MSSAICFNLDQFKILSSGNGLNKIVIEKKPRVLKKALSLVDHVIKLNAEANRRKCLKANMAEAEQHGCFVLKDNMKKLGYIRKHKES